MIIGISGFSKSGKDTCADILCEHAISSKVAFADPIKRIVKDVYDFSYKQLWGPSVYRNAPDVRYPRASHIPDKNGKCICCEAVPHSYGRYEQRCRLTPRYALQQLGTEWGRNCYDSTWSDYLVRMSEKLLAADSKVRYSQEVGLVDNPFLVGKLELIAVPDTRFINEVRALKYAGACMLRVKRKGIETPPFDHPSETEQLKIPDSDFDYIIHNDGDLETLRIRVLEVYDNLSKALPRLVKSK